MKTIKSLKQAKKYSKEQLNVQDLLNGRLYTVNGWVSFKLDAEFKSGLCMQVAQLLGGRQTTQTQVFNSLYYGKPQHWGLRRIIVFKRKNPNDKRKFNYGLSYVAGQDYTYELNQIRNALK